MPQPSTHLHHSGQMVKHKKSLPERNSRREEKEMPLFKEQKETKEMKGLMCSQCCTSLLLLMNANEVASRLPWSLDTTIIQKS